VRGVFGWNFSELECLWPELVEGIVQGFKSVSEVPNASQEAFTLGKFLCSLLSAIDTAVKAFNAPIEPADKIFAREALVFSNNREAYRSHLQFGGCTHK
jgi:hypothetical protein